MDLFNKTHVHHWERKQPKHFIALLNNINHVYTAFTVQSCFIMELCEAEQNTNHLVEQHFVTLFTLRGAKLNKEHHPEY